jgi:predicted pyridoxine 5'-phosphate oxidase superfamily flavin-nucleotide-binding protein
MGHKYADILFSDPVKVMQSEMNSRANFEKWEKREDFNDLIDPRVAAFVAARDSFYLGSVSPDGWPYIQHRGGPTGFLKVLDDKHLGFADYSGNRQYISAGNFSVNDRVSLFLMDYPNQRRLKIIGRIAQPDPSDKELLTRLSDAHYPALIERAYVITVVAFDWNCSRHITPRFDSNTIEAHIAPLVAELAQLKQKLAAITGEKS